MKIDLYFSPAEVPEESFRGKTAVVIDVLRASTSITTAIDNGCREIIPTETVDNAMAIAIRLGRNDIFLCGERGGRMVKGFHIGNSPSEYSQAAVAGKTLVYTSTNGSRAIIKSRNSDLSMIGAFVNISSVAQSTVQSENDIIILCSGEDGIFSLEDTVCGGMLITKIIEYHGAPEDVACNDAALAAQVLYRTYAHDILGMLRTTHHGRYLIEIGFDRDLGFCATIDTTAVIPLLIEGRVVKGDDKLYERLSATIRDRLPKP